MRHWTKTWTVREESQPALFVKAWRAASSAAWAVKRSRWTPGQALTLGHDCTLRRTPLPPPSLRAPLCRSDPSLTYIAFKGAD